ncbi:lysozyme [Qipengyuania aquimaris]|uniref:Lysozyme n=1 Tax=Qipengyuania aquimaris TaxID=255984 RepID=A0A9Q3RZ68_9SPHN|nr:lysozyme [Qipengyuania aquimaris]MBY6217092.1 lysozyme [Qipengyuania aquimaris]
MSRKPLFDTVRRLIGRGFSQSEVAVLDRAIDAAGVSAQDGVPSVPSCGVSEAGLQLIKRFQGCARLRPDGMVEAYPDPGTGGAPWTIGWGATGADVTPDTVWTPEQCDARLLHDVARHAAEVREAIGKAPTTAGQFAALVSFHFNTGAIARATLTRKHVAGDHEGAAREFAKWKHAGGRVLKGLVRRRSAEVALYRS